MPVVSPLVGVFYTAASPGAKAFVQVGDRVERGQVVGIVEAMKVMNEVASDYRGVVKEILVSNGDAVQYEARLMLIDTSGGE
jgi:acetyl-CoA carboxylase biotin carboxyl carrier protein